MEKYIKRIDELGKISLPKVIIDKYNLHSGSSIEITIKNNIIVLRDYSTLKRYNIRKAIKTAMEYFNITEVWAFNANFDYTTLNNTVRYLSGSSCRWFFPYGTQICDIWHIACQVLGVQKTFQWENIRNDNGNLLTNAERMFAYMSSNEEFEEEHTGLADALIETQILARCLRSHKSINKKINRACWRIPQQTIA